MRDYSFMKLLSHLLFCLYFGSALALSANSPAPNIVIIVADDLGWMDVNAYAGYATGTSAKDQFYETPHIDRLSADGISFSRAYSAPLCTPSRAMLLTGRNGALYGFNNAAGLRHNGGHTFAALGRKPYPGYLPFDKIPGTAPRFPIQTATSNFALPNGSEDSGNYKVYALAEMLPEYRSGYIGKWHIGAGNVEGHRPEDFGFDAISYEDEGYSHYRKNIRKRWHHPGPPPQKDYLTDDLTALSIDWIRQQVEEQPGKPFLLYLAHFAVHDPIQAKAEDIAHFNQKDTKGWNQHSNATYAAMIRSLDDSVGAIRASLQDLGVADNTIILFTSDNGGIGVKNGLRITSNQPLRGQKAQNYEGGIRVPFIITGVGVDASAGSWTDVPVSLEDIAPTIAALSGQAVAPEIVGQWTGQSLLPLLQMRPEAFAPRPLFIHEPYYRPDPLTEGAPFLTPTTVMIEGRYKLIAYHDGGLSLFDLEEDISESNDLASAMPERAARMKSAIAEWRFKHIPERYDTSANPRYDPEAENALPQPKGPLFVR